MKMQFVVPLVLALSFLAGAEEKKKEEISEATKLILPSKEEWGELEAASKIVKRGTGGADLNTAAILISSAKERLGADGKTWNTADFVARLEAEIRICAFNKHTVYVVPAGWNDFVRAAKDGPELLRRINHGYPLLAKLGQNANLNKGLAGAIYDWIASNPEPVKTAGGNQKFLLALKAGGVSPNVLKIVMDDLK